ncbi:MAG: hypothetical protein AB1758_06125 [Candidatus Eremiobacterota bacterium]
MDAINNNRYRPSPLHDHLKDRERTPPPPGPVPWEVGLTDVEPSPLGKLISQGKKPTSR